MKISDSLSTNDGLIESYTEMKCTKVQFLTIYVNTVSSLWSKKTAFVTIKTVIPAGQPGSKIANHLFISCYLRRADLPYPWAYALSLIHRILKTNSP